MGSTHPTGSSALGGAPPAAPRLHVHDLSVFYGGVAALSHVTLPIEANSVTALIGPSGCGKSTLLRSLNRMNDIIAGARVEGDVLLDGRSIDAPGTDVAGLRRRVGLVFQKSNPFPKSVFENVAYGLRINGVRDKREIEERVEESLRAAAIWAKCPTASTRRRSPCRGANSNGSASRVPSPSVRTCC